MFQKYVNKKWLVKGMAIIVLGSVFIGISADADTNTKASLSSHGVFEYKDEATGENVLFDAKDLEKLADAIDVNKEAIDDSLEGSLNGISFGQDKDGNWGFIPGGADTVIPFNEGNATKDKVLAGSTFSSIAEGPGVEGTMQDFSKVVKTASIVKQVNQNALITIPNAGYYDGTSQISVPISTIKNGVASLQDSYSFGTVNAGTVITLPFTPSYIITWNPSFERDSRVNIWNKSVGGYHNNINISTAFNTELIDMWVSGNQFCVGKNYAENYGKKCYIAWR